MSDTLEQLHAQAFLDLLGANGELIPLDGFVPDGTDPAKGYVLVYTNVSWPGDGAANAINAQAVTAVAEFNCHCVGLTAAASRAIQAQLRVTVLNKRLTVAGRQSGLIDMTDSLAPSRDETTGTLLMDAVVNYSVITTP